MSITVVVDVLVVLVDAHRCLLECPTTSAFSVSLAKTLQCALLALLRALVAFRRAGVEPGTPMGRIVHLPPIRQKP